MGGFFVSGVVADRSHPAQIQRHVFSLIDRADAVILYAPSGRVGLSAAMEVGNALRAQTASAELATDWLTRRFLCLTRPGSLQCDAETQAG
jgi:hypothetical protein